MISSAKRRSDSAKSLICSCHSKWSCRLLGLVRFCSIGGRSSKPLRPGRRRLLLRAVLEKLFPIDLARGLLGGLGFGALVLAVLDPAAVLGDRAHLTG